MTPFLERVHFQYWTPRADFRRFLVSDARTKRPMVNPQPPHMTRIRDPCATDPGEVLTRFTQSPVSRIRKFMITDLWSLRLLQLSTLFNSISLSWNCYFSNLLNQFFPFDCASPRHLEAWGIFWKKSKNLFVNFFNVYVRFVDLNLSRKKIIITFYHCIA